MSTSINLAAAQFPVSANIVRNADYIGRQIQAAAEKDATVVLFPETALSGYLPKHWPNMAQYPWQLLNSETDRVRKLAAEHKVWVALGSIRTTSTSPTTLPTSCVHVISTTGDIVATYDKQRLYGKETQYFSAGIKPCIVDINGYPCGFLICYDNCFPELYEPYRDAGVRLLFHAFYNAANSQPTSISELMSANLLIRAADNQLWIAAANSSAAYSPLPASIVRPDGSAVRARRHRASLTFDTFPSDKLGWTYNNRE